MKILVIAPEPFFTPRGTPFSVYYRTAVLGELGHDIDLLTYGQGLDVDLPNTRLIRIPGFRRFGRVKVGPSFFKLFLDFFLVLYTIGLLLSHRYDLVHAHEEAVFFCRFLKPLFRFKLVYDMHSSLPQQLTNFEFTSSRILIRIFKYLEDSCLKNADGIITICPDLSEYVDTLLDSPDNHFLIENSIFDPVRLANQPADQTDSAAFSLPVEEGTPCIVYAGTLEPYQGIDILIPAFACFQKEQPDFKLIIVGGTPAQVACYKQLAADHGIQDHCIFTGQVSQAIARQLNSRATILISPRKHGTNTPLKVYEQLASGIPLVATRIHSHTQVLTDEVAILVEPTPEGMAKGLGEALLPTARTIVQNARQLYSQKYSKAAYLQKMERLFSYLEEKMDHGYQHADGQP